MVLSEPPTPLNGFQRGSASVLPSNSGFLNVAQNTYQRGNTNISSNVSSHFCGEGSMNSGAGFDRYSNGCSYNGENPSTSSQHTEHQNFQQQQMFQIQQWKQQQQQQQQLQLQPHLQTKRCKTEHFQQQSFRVQTAINPVYVTGMCVTRITAMYMYHQKQRPKDNSISFWRGFVGEFYAPNATQKLCFSMYHNGRLPSGVFSKDIWHCDLCNQSSGCGFEASFEVLPRLFKVKYDSGTLEERMGFDMANEYVNSSGQIILDFSKVTQQSISEQYRIVREGRLRIVFSPDLKISSWEFCALRHEELVPRKLLVAQVNKLGAAAQKYQTTTHNPSPSAAELQTDSDMFLLAAKQLAKSLELPEVNDLGYSKQYLRCLQISEVGNSMKDLMDYTQQTGVGPRVALSQFPWRCSGQNRPTEEQPQVPTTSSTSQNPTSLIPSNSVAGLSHMNLRQHPSSVSSSRPPHSTNFHLPPTEMENQERISSQPSSSSSQRIVQQMMSRPLLRSDGNGGRVGQMAIPNGDDRGVRQIQEISNPMFMAEFNSNLQHGWGFDDL